MNFKGVAKSTWVRIVSLCVILINLISVSIFDRQLIPFTDEQVYEGVTAIIAVVVVMWSTWKNNSFTEEGQLADDYLHRLKKGGKL